MLPFIDLFILVDSGKVFVCAMAFESLWLQHRDFEFYLHNYGQYDFVYIHIRGCYVSLWDTAIVLIV